MTSKLTREERVQALYDLKVGQVLSLADIENVKMLARMALAAMDSEPVAWVSSESLDSRLAGIEAVTIPFVPGMDIPLFRRPVVTHNGDCDTDPFGFARRSGGLVVIDVNGDPHIKDGMPLYRHAQPAPEYPEILPCPVLLEPGLRFGKGIKTSTMLAALSRRAVYESDLAALSPEERVEFQAGIEGFKALIAQPAPVVPDDVLEALQKVARIRLDLDEFDGDRRGIADCLGDAEEALIEVVNRCAAMLAAAPQEVKDGK